mgnify:CR=1 FL=1
MKRFLPDLTGMRAIVTGSAGGLGRGIAEILQDAGSNVLWTDLKKKERLLKQAPIKKGGRWVTADIGSLNNCDQLVDYAMNYLGGIDLLVNNAATWSNCSFWEGKPQQWLKTMQVNVVGTKYLSRRVAGEMINANIRGSIIFITSIHERVPRRWHFDYSASKAAQRALVQELSLELAPFKIRVNNIAPGHIENRPSRVAKKQRERNLYVPLGGYSGMPDDIGKVVTFLASADLAGYITGASITVDGGLSLHNHWVDQLPLKKTASKNRIQFLKQLKHT